jgi:lysozyme family protein
MIPPVMFGIDDPQFVACLPPVIEYEGYPGNDDDPDDPGGRTHAGIIQREYNVYRDEKHLPHRDVWKADWSEVCEIYNVQYWHPWANKMWSGLNLMYFDQAVNQGPIQAARNVQRAINNAHDPSWTGAALRTIGLKASRVAVDGHIGLITMATLGSVSDKKAFLSMYLEQDLWFYHRLRLWWKYGRGWERRARGIYVQAAGMVT